MESIESDPQSRGPRAVSGAVANGREARAAISNVVDRLEPLRNRDLHRRQGQARERSGG